jgi:eukaryotic-like serine/threonine-protein kinase
VSPSIPVDAAASDPGEVRAELERILTSRVFWHAEGLNRFLRYIVEETLAGRGDAIKEYALGFAVFDRGASFDPKVDTIVRVQARRLRAKLAEFYDKNGRAGALAIELPKGAYIPVFTPTCRAPAYSRRLDDPRRIVPMAVRRGSVSTAPVNPSVTAMPHDTGAATESGSLSAFPSPATRGLLNHGVPGAFSSLTWFFTHPRKEMLGGFIVLSLAVGGMLFVHARKVTRSEGIYTQLTNFTDSATNPAVSPDGRMVCFIRGSSTFLDPGQVYVKVLPSGDPVPLTHDDRLKMAPTFSPDGSRIAYTVTSMGKWETWEVPVIGGEPRPMLANAAALTWFGDRHILFSEIKRGLQKAGLQMAVVVASENRSEIHDVYVPPGMAHRSYVSPDHRLVLIASEMNASGWLPCRVAPIDGGSGGRIVGPSRAKCTYAAWSPDGRWMYFSAEAGGGFHIWRQKFPNGSPEQITFGASDEEGIAMWPDGRSFVSSVGITVSSIWFSDNGDERQITSEGYGHLPSFSIDGKTLYYLLRVSDVPQWAAGELWAADLVTGKREPLLPGVFMSHYEVSEDGTRVVFVRTDPGKEGVWVARVDGRVRPIQLSSDADTRAFFGPADTVIFAAIEGRARYLFRVREDGTGRQKVASERIVTVESVSPDRHWAVVWPGGDDLRRMVAYPLDGSSAVPVCEQCSDGDGGPARGRTPPALGWSPDGHNLYLRLQWPTEPFYETGKTYVLPLAKASALPPVFRGETDVASMPGVQVIAHGGIFPGPRRSLYAFTRAVTHRNLFRISVP